MGPEISIPSGPASKVKSVGSGSGSVYVLLVSGACVPAGVNGSRFPQHFGERCFNRFKYLKPINEITLDQYSAH